MLKHCYDQLFLTLLYELRVSNLVYQLRYDALLLNFFCQHHNLFLQQYRYFYTLGINDAEACFGIPTTVLSNQFFKTISKTLSPSSFVFLLHFLR
ncbi:hypothetical protein wTpre_1385 [Wolbachia endosymbiont of Trichogramma pretiosum]|nr:hypothetical protein wTpre_25 [Wolbachia endosymbiont of Trichogramma pretiosum]OCA07030.1 hypothetical protein wTpre_1385 [Wolbachia endosymbiont of Trichogramma pretiosum]